MLCGMRYRSLPLDDPSSRRVPLSVVWCGVVCVSLSVIRCNSRQVRLRQKEGGKKNTETNSNISVY